jgi:predicted CoA-substrate-specific enzyme activase
MLVAGIDIGAATAKAAILGEEGLQSHAMRATGFDVVRVSREVMDEALKKSGHSMEDLEFVISTGYGRKAVPFADKALTEILCHAKGAHFFDSEVRTVIDIGGQDSKVIKVDASGNVLDFVMNDKCAAGTGRFFEVMAGVLELDIHEMGPISLKSLEPSMISSTCTVFAETEMVSLRAQGEKREDIVAGIHRAAALRIAAMGNTLGFKRGVMLSGGVSKNLGIKKFLEEKIAMEIITPEEPQLVGAIGAALLAQSEAR